MDFMKETRDKWAQTKVFLNFQGLMHSAARKYPVSRDGATDVVVNGKIMGGCGTCEREAVPNRDCIY